MRRSDATGIEIAGLQVLLLPIESAVKVVGELSESPTLAAVHLCNAYTLSLANADSSFRAAVAKGSVRLADGVPLRWTGLLAGERLAGCSPGPDLMRHVLLAHPSKSHLFYGPLPDEAETLKEAISGHFPHLECFRVEPAPMVADGSDLAPDLLRLISMCNPDFVWVGIGTPKQDFLLAAIGGATGGVAIGVGAAFGFLSGTQREVPAFIRGSGLEWAFRLATEPRRLWRRYVFGNVTFIRLAFRAILSNRRK